MPTKNLETPNQSEQIARVCHESIRAYCAALGDHTQVPWDEAPGMAEASGPRRRQLPSGSICGGPQASASVTHEKWLEQKQLEGWRYGPVKNPENKEHPALLPYAKLRFEERMKDYLFAAIVEAFCQAAEGEDEQAD